MKYFTTHAWWGAIPQEGGCYHNRPVAQLFNQVLKLCVAAGLVKMGVVALDGTPIRITHNPGLCDRLI